MATKIGNLLIAFSILFSLFLYGPYLLLFFPINSPTPTYSPNTTTINIPKINASSPIIKNVNPWDQNDYLPKLKKGVAHAQGSSLPGEPGTSFLFAHSSDLPWNLTRYNTAFFRLNELEIGDHINISTPSQNITYAVSSKKIVLPNQVEYLTQNQSQDQLILQTCTPIGTSLKRLLIFAAPIL